MADNFRATKDPDAVLNYSINWGANWLGSDTISTSTWEVLPEGLDIDSNTKTTTVTTVVLSGGATGTEYKVRNTIVTAGGFTDLRTIDVTVKEK